MFMPFVRLIAIYIIVGLAITAFFQRDAIMVLINGPDEEVQIVRVSDLIAANKAAEVVEAEVATPAPAPVFAPTGATEVSELQAPTPAVEPADKDTRLAAARQAYWDQDRVTAEELYSALVADFPTDIALAGEFGNYYYSSQNYEKAGELYYMAGILAHEAGNDTQAMTMIGALNTIAPDLAANLRARIGQ